MRIPKRLLYETKNTESKKRSGENKRMQKVGEWAKRFCASGFSVVLISSFPVIFLWMNNILAIGSFSGVISILLGFLITGVLLYMMLILITHKIPQSALASCFTFFILSNYKILEDIITGVLKNVFYWHIFPCVALLVLLCVWKICAMNGESAKKILQIVSIVVCGMIIFNLFIGVSQLFRIQDTSQQHFLLEEKSEKENVANIGNRNNFYLIVFDEFASFAFMEKYYQYDATWVGKQLEDIGFSVSYSSRNEIDRTIIIMANALNLNYMFTFKDEKDPLVLERLHNNKMFEIFKNNGYEIITVGNAMEEIYREKDEGRQSQVNNTGKTITGEGLDSLLLKQTVIYPFVQSLNTDYEAQIILKDFEYLQTAENFAGDGKFVYAHFYCPHAPFLFDENGGRISASNFSNWEDNRYYRGQYIFAAKSMLQIVDSLRKNDPTATIILCSDHSARASTGGSDYDKFDYFDRCKNFVAVYSEKGKMDIEGKSLINIFRIALNDQFNMNLEEINYVQLYLTTE